MAISVVYTRAANDPTRASSISAYGSAGSGVMGAGAYGPAAAFGYLYQSASATVTALSATGQTGLGNVSVFSDTQNASAAYAVQASGGVIHYVGVATGVLNSMTAAVSTVGYLNSGACTASGIYVMDNTAKIANYQSVWALVSTNAIPHTGPYSNLHYDGTTNLYVLSQTSVEKLALANATSGTWSSLAAPFIGLLDFMFMNSANPCVGGRVVMTQTDIATDAIEFTNQIVAIDKTASKLSIYAWDTNNNLSLSSTLTASGAPTYGAPAINQLLVTDATNGTFRVFLDTAGTWSGPTQTLSLIGAGKIATSSDGLHAVVCQPAQNGFTGFNSSAGTWSALASTSASAATDVVLVDDTTGYVACASGVATISLGVSWTVVGVTSLPIAVTSIALDAFTNGLVYACGTAAGSGQLFSVNGVVTSQVVWAGSADSIVYSNGYICVLDATNSLIRVCSMVNGALVLSPLTYALPAGTFTRLHQGLLDRVFSCGSSGWTILAIQYPYTVTNYYVSVLAQWGGSSWTTTNLGYVRLNGGCSDGTFAYTIRKDNNLYKISAAGAIQAGYPQAIPDYPGQTSGAQLYSSGMVVQGSTIYCASVAGGGIISITGY